MNSVQRSGFTLAEMIVALVLLALLVTLLLQTLTAHQKVFRSFRERTLLSEQLRDAELTLAGDVRGAAVTADTMRLLADSALEFFTTIGSAVVCTSAAQEVTLVPAALSNGLMLTSLPIPPDTGDLFAAYTRPDSISRNRRWVRLRIAAVTTSSASSGCPPGTGFTNISDAQSPVYRITVIGATGDIGAGAPARILRRARYSLYRSSEGNWYLGYKRCNAVATGCSTIQPVSGPYLPYAAATGGGVRFRYLDLYGAPVPSTRPLDVAAVEITVRGEVDASGRITGRHMDSTIILVAPRNLH